MATATKGKRKLELSISGSFDASHRLYKYEGACSNVHGHTWTVRCTFSTSVQVEHFDSRTLNIGIDFKTLKSIVAEVLDGYDHTIILYERDELIPVLLDSHVRVTALPTNPTAEALAFHIYGDIEALLREHGLHRKVKIVSVDVWESPTSCATYRE